MPLPNSKEPMRILFVGAHPHDAIAQAGGTLALHARAGDHVTIAVLTHGGLAHAYTYMREIAQGARGLSEDELNEEGRRLQQNIRDACDIIGVSDVRFLHTVDDILLEERPLIRLVEDVIRDVRPHIIITHHPLAEAGVGFPHATCGKIVMHAFKSSRALRPENPLPAHWVKQIFFITPPQITNTLDEAIGRPASIFINVSETVHLKVKADECVTTQTRGLIARKVHECVEGYWGTQSKMVPYAEVFTPLYPEICDLLPLSGYLNDRWKMELSEEQARVMGTMTVPFLE